MPRKTFDTKPFWQQNGDLVTLKCFVNASVSFKFGKKRETH